MGCVESPPYFTAVTETACDLLNDTLRRGDYKPPNRLKSLASTPPATPTPRWPDTPMAIEEQTCLARPGSTTPRAPPYAYGDVYVDDFILVAQTKRHRQRVLRAALHSIDRVLRPLLRDDPLSRNDPISIKKLRQGDACWSTTKTILGCGGAHRAGTISISDLELAGTLAHKQILVQGTPEVAERPIWLGGDNRASLAWASKGSATASTARAYLASGGFTPTPPALRSTTRSHPGSVNVIG
ncbi:hypothetical protein MHU86_23570 [Fragilaria crotonensis]|nr:hypothetical protein MHU86_23570 [Fragilaria crotonensis]